MLCHTHRFNTQVDGFIRSTMKKLRKIPTENLTDATSLRNKTIAEEAKDQVSCLDSDDSSDLFENMT